MKKFWKIGKKKEEPAAAANADPYSFEPPKTPKMHRAVYNRENDKINKLAKKETNAVDKFSR